MLLLVIADTLEMYEGGFHMWNRSELFNTTSHTLSLKLEVKTLIDHWNEQIQ